MIVTTAQLFKHAYGQYAVGAYNINNAEQAMGLFKGAIDSKAPFIIQISKGARKYTDKRMLEGACPACNTRCATAHQHTATRCMSMRTTRPHSHAHPRRHKLARVRACVALHPCSSEHASLE
jgi:fructose/tagatose bisphosphate aldolase